MIQFQYRGVHGHLHGLRQDVPPRMSRIEYEIVGSAQESDGPLVLLGFVDGGSWLRGAAVGCPRSLGANGR